MSKPRKPAAEPDAAHFFRIERGVLRQLEQDYAATAEMVHVMDAIELCARHGWPIPQWAAEPFIRAMTRLFRFRARTWNDAFGKKPPYLSTSRAQLAAARNRIAKLPLGERIYHNIKERGLTLSRESFALVGKDHGVSGKTARSLFDLYAEIVPTPMRRVAHKRGRKAKKSSG